MATGKSTNEHSAMNQRNFPPWESLPPDVLVECLAYIDASDLVAVRCSNGVFRRAARAVVSRSECLVLSPLATMDNSRVQNELVVRLLQDSGANLKKLDFGGLQYFQGAPLVDPWRTFRNLTSLSLNGCSSLAPDLFRNRAVFASLANLLHLDLTGCVRLDSDVTICFVRNWPNLQTVLLRGCLQMDGTDCLRHATALRQLKVLDLSEMTFTDTQGSPSTFSCCFRQRWKVLI